MNRHFPVRHAMRHEPLDVGDLWALAEAMADQVAQGHTAATDARRSIERLADKSVEMAQLTRSVAHEYSDKLDVAYRRAARAAACNMALMRRIRLEQSRAGGTAAQSREQSRGQKGAV